MKFDERLPEEAAAFRLRFYQQRERRVRRMEQSNLLAVTKSV